MSTTRWSFLVAVLLLGNLASLFVLFRRDPAPAQRAEPLASKRVEDLETSLVALREELSSLNQLVGSFDDRLHGRGFGESPSVEATSGDETSSEAEARGDVATRIGSVEKDIADLAEAFDEFVTLTITGDVHPDFTAEDGYTHAAALAAAKRHGQAAEGYLKFLDAHPDHPDYQDIARKARQELERAGFGNRAIDLQKLLIEKFPQTRDQEFSTLATMQKNAKRYDEAIASLESSIELTQDNSTRMWRLMYRAWYVQLRDGDAAGLEAYREVDRIRESLGITTGNIPLKLNEKMQVLEDRLAASSEG